MISKSLTRIGIAITVIYLIAVVLLGWGEWDKFSELRPNEVGDFLAGVVGPLALLWLILGYFQQGEELRLSTEALRQQAEELRQSVAHQHELVEVTRQHANAQIEAYARDKARERDRLRSVFSLVYSPVVSGSVLYPSFKLENFGYRATEIFIEFIAGGRVFPSKFISALGENASEQMRTPGLGLNDLGPLRVVVAYKDGSGEKFILDFFGEIRSKGNYLDVSLDKPLVRLTQ